MKYTFPEMPKVRINFVNSLLFDLFKRQRFLKNVSLFLHDCKNSHYNPQTSTNNAIRDRYINMIFSMLVLLLICCDERRFTNLYFV